VADTNRRQELFDLAHQVKNYLNFVKSLGVRNLPRVQVPPVDPSVIDSFNETLEDIRLDLGDCVRCSLSASRKRIVFGEGHPKADLMFIGATPDETDDQEGRPFSREGSLLTDIIEKGLEIPRGDCYITTVVKCRPPSDRTPQQNEILTCRPFLFRQITSIRPKIICVLGQTAAQSLLDSTLPLARLRHRFHNLSGFPVMPTFHPEYIDRHKERKRETWEDIKLIKERLRG